MSYKPPYWADPNEDLKDLRQMANFLKIPYPWLRDEAEKGRIPYTKIGSRYFFSMKLVKEALLRRIESEKSSRKENLPADKGSSGEEGIPGPPSEQSPVEHKSAHSDP